MQVLTAHDLAPPQLATRELLLRRRLVADHAILADGLAFDRATLVGLFVAIVLTRSLAIGLSNGVTGDILGRRTGLSEDVSEFGKEEATLKPQRTFRRVETDDLAVNEDQMFAHAVLDLFSTYQQLLRSISSGKRTMSGQVQRGL